MFRLTKRLYLREFTTEDEESLYLIFRDPEVMRYGDGVQSIEWIRGWLQKTIHQYTELGFGPYAVIERQGSTILGYCGLFYFPDVNGRSEIEIGYRFARAAWGKGYATEASTTVRDYAFDMLNIDRLVAIIDPANKASIHVAVKLGMKYEQDVMFQGYTHPDHVYAITQR